MGKAIYNGTEDRGALAEIGVNDAEYRQGCICDDCGEWECRCDTPEFADETMAVIADMLAFQESFDIADAKARAKAGKDKWQA
jgi:hypothetical protein